MAVSKRAGPSSLKQLFDQGAPNAASGRPLPNVLDGDGTWSIRLLARHGGQSERYRAIAISRRANSNRILPSRAVAASSRASCAPHCSPAVGWCMVAKILCCVAIRRLHPANGKLRASAHSVKQSLPRGWDDFALNVGSCVRKLPVTFPVLHFRGNALSSIIRTQFLHPKIATLCVQLFRTS